MSELLKRTATGIALAVVGLSAILCLPSLWFTVFLLFVFVGMAMEWYGLCGKQYDKHFFPYIMGIIFYLTVPLLCLAWLHYQTEAYVLWLVLVVAATDIGAYFVGRSIGRHKIAPKLSPKKTWEGLAGGMLLAGVAGFYAAPYLEIEVGLVLAPCLAVLAQTGDFFESYMKRMAGVKDSGHILPGHGGLLDRFDGLLFVAPTMALLVFLYL